MWSTDFGNTWSGTAEIGDNGSEDPVLCLAIDTSSGIPYAHTLYVGLGNNKGLYKSVTRKYLDEYFYRLQRSLDNVESQQLNDSAGCVRKRG